MRFGEILDALHIGRRKEAKVGDKFDDYHVHAPPRRVATSSRADRRGTNGESHRRLVLSPSGRNFGTRSNHERSERTLSYGRLGSGTAPWKRTISAPRALSEVKHATAGDVSEMPLPLPRRKFYAPNERPVPRLRRSNNINGQSNIHLPDTYLSYDAPNDQEDDITHATGEYNNPVSIRRNPIRQRTEPIAAIVPFDPFISDQTPGPQLDNNTPAMGNIVSSSSNGNGNANGIGNGNRKLPRKSSKKSSRAAPQVSTPAFASAGTRESAAPSSPRGSSGFNDIPPRESDIDSEIALPVGPAVPAQHGYVTDAFRASPRESTASSNKPTSPHEDTSISTSISTSTSTAVGTTTATLEVSMPIARINSKKKKWRPPPLITSGVSHGFAATGLREPLPNLGVDMGTGISGPGLPVMPRPSSAPDTSARIASPRNDGSTPQALPRRNSSKKKKKRPKPLITPGAPHGFASGGLRDPQVQLPQLPNPALPRPNSAPDAYTPFLSPRAPSPSAIPATPATPSPKTRAPSLPRRNSSKKSKKRPTTLLTNGSPHGFATAGLREPAQPVHQAHQHQHQQDTPIIVLSSPPGSASADTRQRKGSRGRTGLNALSGNVTNNNTVRSGSSTSLILNKVRRHRISSSSQQTSSIAQNNNISQISQISQISPADSSAPAAMLAKSNSRARISYSSRRSVRNNGSGNGNGNGNGSNNYSSPSSSPLNPRALIDRSLPPKPLPIGSPQMENDLLFEEANSISSFGESETNRTRDIFRDDDNNGNNNGGEECEEDVFVIGADGVFKGGGFEISKNGMLKSPGNLKRKLSDGKMVDGVPRSSKHLIIVNSLAEFSRGSTLSSRRSNKIDSTIGAGAAGRVSLAVHRPSGRKIAVKRINVFDVQKRTQLLKELETLMCYDSRFLVRSYGAFYDGEGVVHVTLEYMDRGALSDVIELKGAISEDITVHITEHCLKGLEFLHKNHVLHRDFKTSNILMSRRVCRAKLSDFGLARELQEGESKINSFVGTLAYMSPERLNGQEYTYASDVWGLGICVLECLLGHYPFPRPQSYFDYLEATQSNPATLVNGVSDECVDFIKQCTTADPLQRPTVETLLQHPWITGSKRDTNTFRAWLENIPLAHDGLEGKQYSKAVLNNNRRRHNIRNGYGNGNGNNNNSNMNIGRKHRTSNMRDEGLRKAKERAHDLDTHEGIRIGTRT